MYIRTASLILFTLFALAHTCLVVVFFEYDNLYCDIISGLLCTGYVSYCYLYQRIYQHLERLRELKRDKYLQKRE